MTQPFNVAADMIATRAFLLETADKLDDMVEQSRGGGWSTHHSAAQTALANECRRRAARLARSIGEPGELISITILKPQGDSHAKT